MRRNFEKYYRNKFRDDPIIKRNPDKLSKQEEVLLFEIPRILPLVLKGKTNERLHYSNRLKKYSNQPEFLVPLALCENFIEMCCLILGDVESPGIKEKILSRVKENLLSTLNNILNVENKIITKMIVYDEKFLPALVKLFDSDYLPQKLQLLVSETFKIVSKNKQTRSYLCCYEDCELMRVIFQFIGDVKHPVIRNNMLEGFRLLTQDHNVKIVLPRRTDFLNVLYNMCEDTLELSKLGESIVLNLLTVKENIHLIRNHSLFMFFVNPPKSDEEETDPNKVTFRKSNAITKIFSHYMDRGNSKKILDPHPHFFVMRSIPVRKKVTVESTLIIGKRDPFESFKKEEEDDDEEEEDEIKPNAPAYANNLFKKKRGTFSRRM